MTIKVSRVLRDHSKNFEVLVRSTLLSAAYDVFSHEENPVLVYPGGAVKVKTGLSLMFPPDLVLLILPRSGKGSGGLNLKNTVGVIDSDYYPNEIFINFTNNNEYGTPPLIIHPGDQIAQVLLTPRVDIPGAKVLNNERVGGFGSTDKLTS